MTASMNQALMSALSYLDVYLSEQANIALCDGA